MIGATIRKYVLRTSFFSNPTDLYSSTAGFCGWTVSETWRLVRFWGRLLDE